MDDDKKFELRIVLSLGIITTSFFVLPFLANPFDIQGIPVPTDFIRNIFYISILSSIGSLLLAAFSLASIFSTDEDEKRWRNLSNIAYNVSTFTLLLGLGSFAIGFTAQLIVSLLNTQNYNILFLFVLVLIGYIFYDKVIRQEKYY